VSRRSSASATNVPVARAECPWVAARATQTRPDLRGYRVDGVIARELRCGALQWADSELTAS